MSCQQATAYLVQQNISTVCQNSNNIGIGNINNVGGCTSSTSSRNCNYIRKANNKNQTISTTLGLHKSNFFITRAPSSSPTTTTTANQKADNSTDIQTVAAYAAEVYTSRTTTATANPVNSNTQLSTGCENVSAAVKDKYLQNTSQSLQQRNHQLDQATKSHYNAGKKLSNVCIVRPQQQQPQPQHTTHQHHQNHQYHKHQQHHQYQQLQRHKLLLDSSTDATDVAGKPLVASTLPTASLWQTPLLLQTMAASRLIPAAATISTLTHQQLSAAAPATLTAAVITTPSAGVGPITYVAPLVNPAVTTTGVTAMAKVAPIVQAIPALKRSSPCYPNQFENLKGDKANGSSKRCTSPLQTSMFYDAPLKHSSIDINSFGNTFTHKTLETLDEQQPDKEPIDHKNTSMINARTVNELSSACANRNESKTIPPALSNEFCSSNDQINPNQPPKRSSISTHNMTNRLRKASLKARKRKISSSCAMKCDSINNNVDTSVINQKKRRRTVCDLDGWDSSNNFVQDIKNVKAVAVVKMTEDEMNNDTSVFANEVALPYCLQMNWMDYDDIYVANVRSPSKPHKRMQMREKCINAYKQNLKCQAMQLLSTHKLQKLPMRLARRRLVCVDQLLHKYKDIKTKPLSDDLRPQYCSVVSCKRLSLALASYCDKHITKNSTQHIFVPCAGKLNDSTQCRQPVFAINNTMNPKFNKKNYNNDVAFCSEHLHQSYDYYRNLEIIESMRSSSENTISGSPVQLQYAACSPKPLNQQQTTASNKYSTSVAVTDAPGGLLYLGQLLKTTKSATNKHAGDNKQSPSCTSTVIPVTAAIPTPSPSLAPLPTPASASATALVSVPSQVPAPAAEKLSMMSSKLENPNANRIAIESVEHLTPSTGYCSQIQTLQLPPPALAPLSGSNTNPLNNNSLHNCPSVVTAANNSLPLQFLNFAQNSSSQAYSKPCSKMQTDIHTKLYTSTMPNTTVKSSPLHIQRLSYFNSNSNSNFTSSGMGSTTSLPSMDSFLTQDVLSICENSSASSADTGLGGCISDTELMLSQATDADGISLADTTLLEEHDLANALNSLPDDAFTELFASVRGDESDEIERAIEIADKNLRTLEQSIGSNFGDFLDFSDDMLANADGDFYSLSGSAAASTDAATVLGDCDVLMDAAATNIAVSPSAGAGAGAGAGASTGGNDLLTDVKGLLQT